jgi:hypothetical protein
MTAPEAIRSIARDAYTDREGCGTGEAFDAAADAAYAATLHAAYWKLREHASAYRSTKGFRSAMASWEADRHNDQRYASAVLHEWFARGIERAAQEIADLIGVPEHEIEPTQQ